MNRDLILICAIFYIGLALATTWKDSHTWQIKNDKEAVNAFNRDLDLICGIVIFVLAFIQYNFFSFDP
jgi:uncharacterized membrane protein